MSKRSKGKRTRSKGTHEYRLEQIINNSKVYKLRNQFVLKNSKKK